MAETVIKVWIMDGCIVCNACVTECPQVFEAMDTGIAIKSEALKPEFVAAHSAAVLTAAKACPTEVIKYELGEIAETQATAKAAEKPAEKPAAVEKPIAKAAPAAKPEAKAVAKPPAKPVKKIVRYVCPIKRKEPGDGFDPMSQAIDGAKSGEEKAPAKRAKAAMAATSTSDQAPADQMGAILNISGGYSRGVDLDKEIRSGVARNLFKAVFHPKHP